MNTAIVLAAITALATTAGGFLAIKSKDRLHLVLGLSAGLLLGLVAFDLLPEVFELGTQEIFHAPAVSVALIAGFLLLHFYEQLFGSHEPAESDYGHDHKHSSSVAGSLGALAMGGHVFLDGLALGVAFKVSSDLGIAVFIASLESPLWWVFYVLVISQFIRFRKVKFLHDPQVLFTLIFLAGEIAFSALVEVNLGTSFRHRSILLVPLVFLYVRLEQRAKEQRDLALGDIG